MSIDEVCALLGCKRTRVFQLLKAGTIERAPRFGRELRIYTDSVERALARTNEAPKAKRLRVAHVPAPFKLSDVRL